MASTWIIDAFNVIRQSADLALLETYDFEKARALLLSRLQKFSEKSGEQIFCVFDATASVRSSREETNYGRVKVILTKGAETADEVIIEYCRHKKEGAIVVSSDNEIIREALKAGSSVLSSQEFDRLLRRVDRPSSYSDREEEEGFDPKRGTQKKGPARRRSKKDRKVSGKIQKIFN